jgi:hypothetical protein
VEHFYQTSVVVLLANPTNGQETIGHRPAFSWSTRSRVPRIKTCSRPSPFPEVYTRRSAASIVHTADELIPGILSDVKDPVCVDSYSRSYVWLYDRESVTTWPSPLHIHLNPTANYRANK